MKQRSIEVTVAFDGSLKIEAMGFVGVDCEKATAFLEEALGARREGRRKPEFCQGTAVRRQQKVGA
jgi:hypothetical protein